MKKLTEEYKKEREANGGKDNERVERRIEELKKDHEEFKKCQDDHMRKMALQYEEIIEKLGKVGNREVKRGDEEGRKSCVSRRSSIAMISRPEDAKKNEEEKLPVSAEDQENKQYKEFMDKKNKEYVEPKLEDFIRKEENAVNKEIVKDNSSASGIQISMINSNLKDEEDSLKTSYDGSVHDKDEENNLTPSPLGLKSVKNSPNFQGNLTSHKKKEEVKTGEEKPVYRANIDNPFKFKGNQKDETKPKNLFGSSSNLASNSSAFAQQKNPMFQSQFNSAKENPFSKPAQTASNTFAASSFGRQDSKLQKPSSVFTQNVFKNQAPVSSNNASGYSSRAHNPFDKANRNESRFMNTGRNDNVRGDEASMEVEQQPSTFQTQNKFIGSGIGMIKDKLNFDF